MNSFRLVTYECIKDSTTVEKADIKTIVITDGNRTQLCDGLIIRPEESYRLWRVVVRVM